MEKHTCKVCFRRFANGRALGGHMRSHVAPGQRTPALESATARASGILLQRHCPSVSLPSASSSSSGPEGDEGEAQRGKVAAAVGDGGFYALRENPRKSFKFVDPEFATVDYACYIFSTSGNNNNNSASVVVQDRESETESSVPPCSSSSSVRRRSKRLRRQSTPVAPPPPAAMEVEPVSSVSDTSPDEDVARCLVMLSRDFWAKTIDSSKLREGEGEEKEEELVASSEEEEKVRRRSKKIGGGGRSWFQCGTCKKVFRSYQALGGHRANHKKIKTCIAIAPGKMEKDDENNDNNGEENEYDDENRGSQIRRDVQQPNAGGDGYAAADPKIHECPFCFRVFNSGQALGGHKRSHLASGSYPLPPPPPNSSAGKVHPDGGRKDGESLIDLNLPAPTEDEEAEFSAVSDTTP